jgi:hypothetical protein
LIVAWKSTSQRSARLVLFWRIDPDALSVLATIDRAQIFALARAGDAFATLDQKQCAVGRALNQAGAGIEKLVRVPLQGHAAVRATVPVDMNLTRAPDRQELQPVDIETSAFSLSQVIPVTQVFQRSLLRA